MIRNSIKFIIGGILLLFATISFAAVLDYYTKMEGSGQVIPPEFYIGSLPNETLLFINKKSSDYSDFEIENEYRTFKTEILKETDFIYLPDINFYVRAKGISNSTSTPVLQLTFGYYKSDDITESYPRYLAKVTTDLSETVNNYTFLHLTASENPKNIRRFFYEFKGLCPDCSYLISKYGDDFYTKVELSE